MAFELNFGKNTEQNTDPAEFNLDSVLSNITPVDDLLSGFQSWGSSMKPGGGFDFQTPSVGDSNQFPTLGGTGINSAVQAGSGWQNFASGVQGLTGLAGAYLGYQQMNLAKDQLAQNKKIFNLNFENQAKTVNTQLEDRQRARVASNAGAYQSVGDYMDQNQVSTKGI